MSTLEELGRQRTIEARGERELRTPWLPDTLDEARAAGITDVDVLQAITFYRTSRGHHERSTNRRLSRSDALLLGFDAFHPAEDLLTQPVEVIVGGRPGTTGSYEDGRQLWERAPNSRGFHMIEGAGHYELYDEPAYVDQVVEHLGGFFTQHLARRAALSSDGPGTV